MSEPRQRLTAADLRARLGGGPPEDQPPSSVGHAVAALLTATEPGTPAPPPADLVKSTFDRYANAPKRTGFRRGAEQAELASPGPVAKPLRSNKFAGTCVTCGTRVEAEAGSLERGAGGWITAHLPGQCPPPSTRSADPVEQAVAASEQEVPPGFVKITAVTGQTYVGLQPGVYTLETAQGHRTFRVRVQSTEEDFAPGKTILDYLTGPDNGPRSKDWTGFAFLNGTRLAVWKKFQDKEALVADARTFLADPSQALLAATCIRCNASLSTPESIRALMGPDCRKKGW